MGLDMSFLVGMCGTFFALLNPVGNMPIFLAYTRDYQPKVRHAVAVLLSGFIFGAMVVFLFTGQMLLSFFGITVQSFQIAGGIILFGIGLSMMSGSHSTTVTKIVSGGLDQTAYGQARSILPALIVPLGIPLYVGPGTIASAILYGSEAPDHMAFSGILVVMAIMAAVIMIFNLASDAIAKLLGSQGIEIVVRVMGLILAAIAVQMFIEGVGGATVGIINPKLLKW